MTGCAGFLGTHVAEHFKNLGWNVIGIDNLNEMELKRAKFDAKKSRKHNLNFLEEIGVDFHRIDCSNSIKERRIIKSLPGDDFHGIDFIIHCAAQPAMTIAIEEPVYDMDNNIRGTVNMLEIAKGLQVPFVNCSSIHIYGNNSNSVLEEGETRFYRKDKVEIDESEPILNGALTPLHVSKRATELYTQTYAETYGMRTASFRLTGMYGERQFGGMDHGWVANFAIRNVLNRPITIFDTDKQVRDILYAKDAARAFEDWFNKGSSGIYNIGGGMKNSISLQECLSIIATQTNQSNDITFEPKRFGDLYYFVCDYKKAQKDFGWKPTTSPEEGLRKLIKWIEQNKEIL